MTSTHRLLLVDDHPLIRAGIRAQILHAPEFSVEWEAANAGDALALFQRHEPELTLMDVGLPDGDGIECVRAMLAVRPSSPVIMLSSNLSDRDVRRARVAGARGYIGKTVPTEEFVQLLRAVMAGEMVFRHVLTGDLSEAEPVLTARELEVLGYLRRGFTNHDVATALGISERTARAHVEAILRKLEAADRAEAVAIGFETGLLMIER